MPNLDDHDIGWHQEDHNYQVNNKGILKYEKCNVKDYKHNRIIS